MTAWYLRWLLKPFLGAGWTVADVLHALDVRPDGSAWTYTWQSVNELRHIPGWVRHRLGAWLDEDGQVLPSRSQREMSAAARRRAEQEGRRRARLATAAVAGLEFAEESRMSRAEALAPFAPAGERSDPNQAFRAARAELELRRKEREAEIAAVLARRCR
ncbi:hypothetical protein ACFQYP_00970 [Nonomuraea antimicrobica]